MKIVYGLIQKQSDFILSCVVGIVYSQVLVVSAYYKHLCYMLQIKLFIKTRSQCSAIDSFFCMFVFVKLFMWLLFDYLIIFCILQPCFLGQEDLTGSSW
jgi:uncharacterized protein with PQ loop repeat